MLSNAVRLYNEGDSYQSRGLVREAVSKWHETVKLNPNFIDARYNLGLAYMIMRQADNAIEQFKAILEITPSNLDARLDLALAYEQKGQIDDAILKYSEVLSIDKLNRRAHKNMGIALAKKGKRNEAFPHLEIAVSLDPNDSDSHYVLGDALLREYLSSLESGYSDSSEKLTEMLDKSRNELETACQLNPRDTESIRSLEVAKDPRKFLKLKRKVEHGMKEEYNRLLRQSIELVQSSRDKEAIPYLEEAIIYEPNVFHAHYLLGHILREDGQFDRAVEELRKAHELNPKDQLSEAELYFAQTRQTIRVHTYSEGTLEEILKKY